jgi:hypothetical protein
MSNQIPTVSGATSTLYSGGKLLALTGHHSILEDWPELFNDEADDDEREDDISQGLSIQQAIQLASELAQCASGGQIYVSGPQFGYLPTMFQQTSCARAAHRR